VRKLRGSKAKQREPTDEGPGSRLHDASSKATWQSVIADAEELMAELRRTIEWAREYTRNRVSFRD